MPGREVRRNERDASHGKTPSTSLKGVAGRSVKARKNPEEKQKMGVPGALRPAGTPIFYAFFRCSLPVACGRLPFHNTPRITWSASVTVINDVMRLTRYVRAGSRESRYDGKRHKPDD